MQTFSLQNGSFKYAIFRSRVKDIHVQKCFSVVFYSKTYSYFLICTLLSVNFIDKSVIFFYKSVSFTLKMGILQIKV